MVGSAILSLRRCPRPPLPPWETAPGPHPQTLIRAGWQPQTGLGAAVSSLGPSRTLASLAQELSWGLTSIWASLITSWMPRAALDRELGGSSPAATPTPPFSCPKAMQTEFPASVAHQLALQGMSRDLLWGRTIKPTPGLGHSQLSSSVRDQMIQWSLPHPGGIRDPIGDTGGKEASTTCCRDPRVSLSSLGIIVQHATCTTAHNMP